jgi:prepilin peptidase CpaA
MIPFLVAALVVSLVGAVIDLKTGHIPNWLTLVAIPLGPVAHLVNWLALGNPAGESFYWMGWAAFGVVVCAAPSLVLWRGGAIGGGDVKLLAAIGGMVGPRRSLDVVPCVFAVFLVQAIVTLARRGQLRHAAASVWRLVTRPFRPAGERDAVAERVTELRMGPSIFVGTLVAFVWEYFWFGHV